MHSNRKSFVLAVSIITFMFCYQKQFLPLEKEWLKSKISDLKKEKSKPEEKQEDERKRKEKINQEEIKQQEISLKATIWVSMSLCWSENAQIYGKAAFPYALGMTLQILGC